MNNYPYTGFEVDPADYGSGLVPAAKGRKTKTGSSSSTVIYNRPTFERDIRRVMDDIDPRPRKETRAYQQPLSARRYKTYEDKNIASSIRPKRPHHWKNFYRWVRGWHPFVWGVIVIALIIAFYSISTSGAAWWTTTLVDPGTYGPAHGQIVSGIFGGGDSEQQPSKLYSINDGGQFLVIKLASDNPAHAQIITVKLAGPLVNFPDPQGAEVALSVGDFNHDGHEDVMVTIESPLFDKPFHRYVESYILYGDGKGNLKQQ